MDTRIPLYEVVRELDHDFPYYSDINALLETGKIDVNAKDHEGNTGLHIMVQNGFVSIDTVQLLLEHGFDATITNNAGKTAKAYVSDMCGGEPEAMREEALWTKAIYGINGKDEYGRSPLDYAWEWTEYDESFELVGQLVKEGATIDDQALLDTFLDFFSVEEAIILDLNKYIFMEIVKRKGEGDITSFIKKQPKHLSMRQGEYFLEVAVDNGSVDIADLLLDHGVMPNFLGKWRRPPLFLAAAKRNRWLGLEMVSILLARGAHSNYKDRHGNTPYHYREKKKKSSTSRCSYQRPLAISRGRS